MIVPQHHAMLRLGLALLILLTANAAHADVPRVNCAAPHQRDLDLNPRAEGPLRLATIHCQPFYSQSGLVFGAPLVSPDAQSIAFLLGKEQLLVARLDGGKTFTEFPAVLGTFTQFGSNFRSVHAFAWRSDSKAVWTGTHEMAQGGFPRTPLRPVQAEDGGLTPLPALRHDAGPLDGLLWIGGDGLALVHFGTRGSFYRPAVYEDRTPTLAIVDAQRGVVLDALPFDAVESLKNRGPRTPPYVLVRDAAATLRDGKVRALLDIGFGEWLAWSQGQPPRVLANPYGREMHNRMAISPDGTRVLIGRLLRTEGGRCDLTKGCRPGTPVEGILAALHDLDTGALVWSLRATVANDHEFPAPVISPDGRYALIGLVPDGERLLIGLVSMQDGKTVQTVPAPGADYTMGFVRGGQIGWIHAYGVTALYDMQSAAPAPPAAR